MLFAVAELLVLLFYGTMFVLNAKLVSYQALILEVFGGFNLVSISGFIWVFMLNKSGLFLKVLWQQCRARGTSASTMPANATCAIVLHAFCIAIFIRLNRLSRNTSKHLS